MSERLDVDKIIKGLECCATNRLRREDCEAMDCTYLELEGRGCIHQLIRDAFTLLKVNKHSQIKPKRVELADETKAWLDKMDAVEALGNIANICIDWDGYRTADGLGGIINEIWAYARYCADRLANEQEPRVMTLEEVKVAAGHDVWLELSGNIADDVLFAATIEGCGTKGLSTRYESLNYSAYGIRPYGWRCWTSRPDEKRRAETPWH